MASRGLAYEEIRSAFDQHALFEDKTWRLSPQAWPLDARQLKEIEAIGQACLEFHRALETLYLKSAEGKNILRNRTLTTPWVTEYLDRGKPEHLLAHARSDALKSAIPAVLRPDLLLTDDGFALTEMDSVPGGIGLTAYLNRLYAGTGQIVGADDAMIDAFYAAITAQGPDKRLPMVAIVVSDEASTYRPEMDWIAEELQRRGKRVYAFHPDDIMPLGDSLCANVEGNPEEIDIVYRFWELFDFSNIPIAAEVRQFVEEGRLTVTPPMRPFQEEKLNLALFHHHLLSDYWRESLSKRSHKLLKQIIPRTWIMDPVDLPPNAVLDAPTVGGNPIYKWSQLAEASQKERNLIIKLSGFHENAWGARSVLFGSDASRSEWADGIEDAVSEASKSLSILQEYRKPKRLKHPVYSPEKETYEMSGRLRLCPYYFIEGDKANLAGVLATFCPADKKIIHGMRDAALLPCALVDEGDS